MFSTRFPSFSRQLPWTGRSQYSAKTKARRTRRSADTPSPVCLTESLEDRLLLSATTAGQIVGKIGSMTSQFAQGPVLKDPPPPSKAQLAAEKSSSTPVPSPKLRCASMM
jgi:hypothetical protein